MYDNVDGDLFELLKRSEGCELVAYRDKHGVGQPWTIAYGDTENVYEGLVITQEEADARLVKRVADFVKMVRDNVPVISEQRHINAFVDFAYNMGAGARGIKDGFVTLANGNIPTIRRAYIAGNFAAAADEFPKWANPPLPGLIVRRARERDMFLGRDWRLIPDGDVVTARAHNEVPA